ncbi:hypothetical protein GCM10009832_22080 [Dietzia kunjamensis subsp. schimae]
MSTRFRRATLPAVLAAAALAMGVASPVAQAQPTRPFTTVFNEATGTWYTSPNEGAGNVKTPPIFNPDGTYETQFVIDAVSNNPCEVTFSITNATNATYSIVWRIDGELGPPDAAPWAVWNGRRGVVGEPAGGPGNIFPTVDHTWGWKDAVTTQTTINLLTDLDYIPNRAEDAHTISYALIGPESDYINPDVSALASDPEEWETVDVAGCAEPPVECPVCEDSGSLGSIAEGSLGSLEGGDGSLSDSAGSDGGVDGSLAALTGSLAGSVGSAAGSDEDGSLGDLTGSLSDSLGAGSDEDGSLGDLTGSLSDSLGAGSDEDGSTGDLTGSLSDSLGQGSLGAGSLTASLAPVGSAAGSLPLLIPVALIGGSLAAAPMIQQSLAGLNIQLPALPEFPPLAGSAMPGMPPVVGPPPAPAVPNPDNGRG